MESTYNEELLHITLPDGGVVELRRCDDAFFSKAVELSMPIELKNWRLTLLSHQLKLPQIYAALTVLTGPTGELHDPDKGAFSFTFKLTVRRGERQFRYLLWIDSMRTWVELRFYRVQRPGESYSNHAYHDPFDDELSEKDCLYIVKFLEAFLQGFLKTMPRWTTPFLKEIRSNGILFGYNPQAEAFFVETHFELEAYRAALQRWRTLIPHKTLDEEW